MPTRTRPARSTLRPRVAAALVTAGLVLVPACGSSDDPTTTASTTTAVATTTATGDATTPTSGRASGDTTTTTVDGGSSSSTVDPTHLPIGDGRYGSTAEQGYVMTCQQSFQGSGAEVKGPWFNDDGTTWDSTEKGEVDGDVAWEHVLTTEVADGVRTFVGNDLPDHTTGEFPIGADDDVYAYDRNPNSIAEQALDISVPAEPEVADEPTCIGGEVGLALTGVAIFSAFDAGGRDAVAWEAQDHCQGHPQPQGAYHYHSLTTCIADPGNGQSALLGYAYDGFGIYGMRGEDGQELTDADLDECHGTTSPVLWDGELVTMYHYVATREFPYTVGCFRGTPTQNRFGG